MTPSHVQIDIEKFGVDSIAQNGKIGASLINKAIVGIKKKCDNLHIHPPKNVISQLYSAAEEMGCYFSYLRGSGNYATKNIYMGNLHMVLWRMYAVLWSPQQETEKKDTSSNHQGF